MSEDEVKKLKKAVKFEKLCNEVEEFIAAHEISNPHYLRDEEIVKYFSYAKEKHVRNALKEVR